MPVMYMWYVQGVYTAVMLTAEPDSERFTRPSRRPATGRSLSSSMLRRSSLWTPVWWSASTYSPIYHTLSSEPANVLPFATSLASPARPSRTAVGVDSLGSYPHCLGRTCRQSFHPSGEYRTQIARPHRRDPTAGHGIPHVSTIYETRGETFPPKPTMLPA
jgi:hypothetical protein